MKVAILGAGFGLYGYLPALLDGHDIDVLLPERYRAKLGSRGDVGHLVDRVEWRMNEEQLLDDADAVVVALRPEDQVQWIEKCLTRANISRLLLEKPLAPTPQIAMSLFDRIERSGKTVRMGYNLRYTAWGRDLLRDMVRGISGTTIEMEWLFKAHHYATNQWNWKRSVSSGGGAVRFYGIHVIALLAELGYMNPQKSNVTGIEPDDAQTWQATFRSDRNAEFRIRLDANSISEGFRVRWPSRSVALSDPFEAPRIEAGLDRRVEGLAELCRDFITSDSQVLPWYRDVLVLWQRLEAISSSSIEASV